MKRQIKVMVFGTFDVLHPGHIEFLRQAKKLGDYLIVSLAREKYIRKIKGHPARHTEPERRELLQAVRFVDEVVLGSRTDYLAHILRHRPQVIALGYDQTAFVAGLAEKLRARGLAVKIVRLKPYKAKIYKTRKLWRNFTS